MRSVGALNPLPLRALRGTGWTDGREWAVPTVDEESERESPASQTLGSKLLSHYIYI